MIHKGVERAVVGNLGVVLAAESSRSYVLCSVHHGVDYTDA